MFLSNPAKSFLASIFILFSTAGCGLLKTGENAPFTTVEEPKSRFPFKTKEPENFQCDIVETTGEAVRRKRLAKKGTSRRIDFDPGEKTHRALLQTDRSYVIDVGRGIYAENAPAAGGQFSELTHELLSTSPHAEFEEIAREGTLVSYTVRPAGSSTSEIVVHYDESIGMPVKQEFFSVTGEGRSLEFTVESVNFRPDPEADLFSLPANFRRVPMNELLNPATR
jgi:hypothetical protein